MGQLVGDCLLTVGIFHVTVTFVGIFHSLCLLFSVDESDARSSLCFTGYCAISRACSQACTLWYAFPFSISGFFISLSVHLDHCHQTGLIASTHGTCVVNFGIYLNLTLVAFYSH